MESHKLLSVMLFMTLFVTFSTLQTASAHPLIVETEPGASSSAESGLKEIIVHYNEAVEIKHSTLKVLNQEGKQVDNKDTHYPDGDDTTLVITTPSLEDGVYTVTSKVLSRVDGHVVSDAFVIGVGEAKVTAEQAEKQQGAKSAEIFFPEAAARFPGMVGQSIVLGAIIAMLVVWNSFRTKIEGKTKPSSSSDKDNDSIVQVERKHYDLILKLLGISIVAVFASDFAIIGVQAMRLGGSPIDAIQTSFGNVWLARLVITSILLGLWFWIEKRKADPFGKPIQITILGLSLALISTTTLWGHALAGDFPKAGMVLDYVHNLIAGIWIGGIIYFAYCLIPSLKEIKESKKRESLSLMLIPRFSIVFVLSVGVLIITGPTLLWLIQSDLELLSGSAYGLLIIAKIVLAAGMIGHGAYNQYKIQGTAEKNRDKNQEIVVHQKMNRSLKTEIILGIVLLAVVAILTNSSVPAVTIDKAQAEEGPTHFRSIEFSQNAKFDVTIKPLSTGKNTITADITTIDGKPIPDITDVKMKVSNPGRNVAPIELETEQVGTKEEQRQDSEQQSTDTTTYEAKATFGFPGNWLIEIEALRTEAANESIAFEAVMKPSLENTNTEIKEFKFPGDDAKPLFSVFDEKRNTLWISDTAKPRIWKFSLESEEFTSYDFDGKLSTILAMDTGGNIWFNDIPSNQIGKFSPSTEKFELVKIPVEDGIPTGIETDRENNVWVSLSQKNKILKYIPDKDEFEEFTIPTKDSGPAWLLFDKKDKMWFTESRSGKIGYIDMNDGNIEEFVPEKPLKEPFYLYFDQNGMLWVAEHEGPAIVKFDTTLKTFDRVLVSNEDSLPYGMTEDEFGNIWFAQHIIDFVGVYDPYNDELEQIKIPTKQSFAQFLVPDDDGNIWFAEQRGNKLGKLSISSVPQQRASQERQEGLGILYGELVSPLVAAGIITTSLFYIKGVNDKKRIDSMVEKT